MSTVIRTIDSELINNIILDELHAAINADVTITTTLLGITHIGDNKLSFHFAGTLSQAELTQLDLIIAGNVPTTAQQVTTSNGVIRLETSLPATKAIIIRATDTIGGIDVDSGTGGFDLDTTGAITMTSGSSGITLDSNTGPTLFASDSSISSEIRLQDQTGGEYVGIDVPTVVSSSYTITLPSAVGSSGQVLRLSDGSGNLEFGTVTTDLKSSVRVATTVAGTLATDFENLDIIDGVTLATGDRILIKDQASGVENGIYTVNASGAPTRASDYASSSSVAGTLIIVKEGTSNADTGWLCTNDSGSDVVGTDALVFVKVLGEGSGSADVMGPGSATDNALARFDGTTGKTIQNSGVTLDDSQNMAGVATINVTTALRDANSNEIIAIGSTASAINEITVSNAATGTNPQISSTGGDTNIGLDFQSKGTGVFTFDASSASEAAEVRLQDNTGGQYLGVKANATTTSYTVVMPPTQGGSGEVLENDGAGNLSWATPSGSGDVNGPASATDNAITRFDGTTGKLIQNSGITIDDSNNVAGVATIDVTTALRDVNSNEIIAIGSTASAVNEITVTNAATGNNPEISATGGDANVGLDFQIKGTGVYNFFSTTSGPSDLRWYEDLDNGVNYLSITAPAVLGSNQTLTLPDATDTLVARTTTDTLTNKTLTSPAIGTSIIDTNGNELFLLTATASAVNQVTYANSATGTNPSFTVSGDDTNIGLDLTTKGSGVFNLAAGSATSSAEVRFQDNTGGQYIGLTVPATVASSRTHTLPDLANDTVVVIAGAQTLTNKTIDGDNNTISNLAHGAEVDNPSSGVHGVTGNVVGTTDTQTLTNKTLTSPVLTTPQINDTSEDHQYIVAVNELVADRTVTLPLLTGNDTFVFEAHTATLTNKTITGSTNTVSADNLKTTGADVDVVSASPPTTGQVLQATSATTATWQYRGWRQAVRVATTTDGALATAYQNGDTVDGVLLATGNRILLKDQSTGAENGIYTVNASGAPTRASDYASGSTVDSTFVLVQEGTTNADTMWICTNNTGSATVGTDALTFAKTSDDTDDLASTLATGNTTGGNSIVLSGASDTLNFTRTNNLILDSATIATTDRTLTFPDPSGNDSVTYLALAQTLTNKTLTSPIINQITTDGTEEVLILADGGTAINEFTMTNASTGSAPELSATGDDANVGLNFLTKGTGAFNFSASGASTSASLQLQDNTGGQYIAVTVPATVASNRSHTIPDTADDTFTMNSATQTLTNKTLTSPAIGTNILDTNGNELLLLTATASAVNELTYANAATGTNPTLTTSGSDANIGFDFQVKGTGTYNLLATTSGPSDLRLYEDLDNGNNYVSLLAPASMIANRVLTLPDATDTLVGRATTDTLTNKTIDGDNNTISNLAHGAEVDDPSSGVHGVTGNVVGTTDSQTLTNKTLTSPRIGTSVLDTNGNELFLLTATASAVNEITYANAATGSNPLFSATGGDTNIGIEFRTKGTGTHIFDNDTVSAEIRLQDATGTDYVGIKANATTTSYTVVMPAAQGGSSTVLQNDGSGNLSWVIGGGDVDGPASATDNAIARFDGTTGKLIQNSGLGVNDSADLIDANGNELIDFTATGSAVNQIAVSNSATGTDPQISVTGDDANVGLDLLTKGTGTFSFAAGGASTSAILELQDNTGGQYIAVTVPATVASNRTHTVPDTADDTFTMNDATQTLTNKTLTSPVLTTPQINDTSLDHQYIVAVNELVADRTVTLPLLTGNDTFVFEAHTATLTNKTITGSTNTVSADNLKTTGADVDVVSANPPTTGQVLQATSATTATWQYRGWRQAVRVATTTDGALATAYENGDTVDGVLLATGNRILLKDQSTGAENGIYTVNASGAPTRASDYASGSTVDSTFVVVQEGTTNADTMWICTNNTGSATVGTDALTFAKTSDDSDTLAATLATGNTTGGNDIVLSGASDTINFTRTNNLILDAATIATTDRTVTFPDPSGDDSVTYLDLAQTLTNKTLTSPAIGTSILDTNGNELFLLTATASAVNELTYANAATGNNPTLTASGGDANVGFDFQVKGTGTYNLLATTSGPTDLRLYEDLDNGTNYVSLLAPASMTTNRVLSLPDTTDTLVGRDTTDTLTNKTLTSPAIGTSILDTNGNELFLLTATASAVNEITYANAATGGNPSFTASGGDTDVGLNFTSKGTGNFTFAAGSAISSAILRLEDNTGGQSIGLTVPTTVTNRTHTIPDTSDDTFAMLVATQTLTNKTIDADNNTISNLAHGAEVDNPSSGVHGVTGNVVGTTDTQTLSNKTLTLPQINDTSVDHQYIFAVNELVADRTVTLPLLTGNDTFVFEAHTATLTNKTISGSTNTVSADNLKTTGADVDVVSANPPTLSQKLKATSATTATWQYDDLRDNVRVATTADGALATAYENLDTVDGITLATGDRILIKNQSTATENGLYTVNASGAPTRAGDYASGSSVAATLIFVQEGTTNADTGWLCTNNSGSDVVGTDNLAFSQVAGPASGGDVSGPASATDNAIARFDGTTGKTIQNSGLGVNDSADLIDTNGNELIDFTATGSAVNQIGITNAATANNPIISATGGDTNIGLDFLIKGTGTYNFLATTSGPSDLRWYEDADNGTNYVSVIAPATIGTNRTLTLPDATDTLVGRDTTDTLTNKTLTSPQINDTSLDHQYIIAVNELVANRTVTLPLLTGNDTFVFEAHTATLTNKTITGSTNTVSADNLKTTGADVDVVSASPPTLSQKLKATSATTATWQYDDLRDNVRVATTADGALATAYENLDTIDGVTLATGDRILIKNQSTATENGIYTVNASGAPTRAGDYASSSSVAATLIFVQEGTTNADTGWLCTNNSGSDVVGTDNLAFSQVAGPASGGDVSGPASSTDNAIARFDGTTGKTIQNSGLGVNDSADLIDTNGNELIDFTATGSAVNQIGITNAATANNPIISATGGDTNIGLDFQVKGTGVYNLLATASGPTDLRLYEDTDNGTNYVSLLAPASMTSNRVLTLPDATDTLVGRDTTDTLTNKTLTSPQIGTSILDTNGNELFLLTATGSAVNEFTVANAATGNRPTLSATGGDTNIGIALTTKGTGTVVISAGSATTSGELRIEDNTGGQYIGITVPATVTSRTHTLPDTANDTFTMNAATQTLTNKTLTAPIIGTVQYGENTLQTTDGTQTTITTIATASNRSYLVVANIAAMKTNTNGKAGGFVLNNLFRNDAGSLTKVAEDALSMGDFSATMNVSGTNIVIQVTGSGGDTVQWKNHFKVVVAQV